MIEKLLKPLAALSLCCALVSASHALAKDKAAAAPRTVEISVTENGFQPSPISVKKGEPLKLVVTRKTDETCATELVIKDYGIDKQLPLNKPVEIAFTPTKSGELKYGCAMGMMVRGVLLVE